MENISNKVSLLIVKYINRKKIKEYKDIIIKYLKIVKVYTEKRQKIFVIGSLLCALILATSGDLRYYINNHFDNQLTYIYLLFIEKCYLNLIVECILFVLCVKICILIYKNKYFSWHYFFFVIGLFCLLYHYSPYDFANELILNISYYYILIILSLLPLCIEVIKLICSLKYKKTIKKKGYSDDRPLEAKEGSLRYNYAEIIYNQLINTDVEKEAFSVSITGNWGSGKTTFLNNFISILRNKKANFMLFNPWDSISPSNLVEDFFNQLNEKLSGTSSVLSDLIFKYSKELTRFDLHPMVNKIMDFIPNNEECSLSQIKSNIEGELQKIKQPLFILIDDIDRLDKNEIFEVMRLIRNTAKFPNIIYIVTLDKKYVLQQLSKRDIQNSDLYLDKIFPLEIALPKVEERDLFYLLKHEIRGMSKQTTIVNSFLDSIPISETNIIIKILDNYRKVKRFSRICATNINFLHSQYGTDVINVHDLFYIELLNYRYPEICSIIKNRPNYLLALDVEEERKIYCYSVRKDITELINEALALSEALTQEEIRTIENIIDLLFDGNNNSINSIRIHDNFDYYFCLGVPKDIVSKDEFEKMLQTSSSPVANNGMKHIINQWVNSKQFKKEASIHNCFLSHNTRKNDMNIQIAYVRALMFWLMVENRESYFIDNSLCDCLILKRFTKEYHIRLKEEAQRYLRDAIDNQYINNNFNINNALSFAYSRAKQKDDMLFSAEEITDIMCYNFDCFVKDEKWISINIIKEDGNILNTFIENSAVEIKGVSVNPISRHVVDWATQEKRKSIITEDIRAIQTSVVISNKIPDEYSDVFSKVFNDDIKLFKRYFMSCFKKEGQGTSTDSLSRNSYDR